MFFKAEFILIVLSACALARADAIVNPLVFMDITANGEEVGRLVFELRADVVPITAENFRALCTGKKGYGYKGTKFDWVVPGFKCQGGDVTEDGRGGFSIYGSAFHDENFTLKHTGPGILSMANRGPDTNASQFFITFTEASWLDGKYVVFGEVVEGYEHLKKIETYGSDSGLTTKEIVIADCGEL